MWLGNLAEAKVAAELIRQRFEVFTSTTGKAPFDLVAYQDGRLLRVEVRGISQQENSGSYSVRLTSTRGTTGNGRRYQAINRAHADLLAVYVLPWDSVAFIAMADIVNKQTLTFRNESSKFVNGQGRNWIMADLGDAGKAAWKG